MIGSETRGDFPTTPGGYHDADFLTIYDWMWSPNGLGLKLGSMKAVLYARIYGASHHSSGAMFESQSSLATSLGFSRQKTSEALKGLVADGLVSIVGRLGSSPKSPALYVANLNRVAAAIDSMRLAASLEGTTSDSSFDAYGPMAPVIDEDILASCGFQQIAGRTNVENSEAATVRWREEAVNGRFYVTSGDIQRTKGDIGSTCGLLKTTTPLATCENVNESPAQRGCINPLTINAASIEGEGEGEGTNKALKTRRVESDGLTVGMGRDAETAPAGRGGACKLSPDATEREAPFWELPEPDREAFDRLLRIGKHVDGAHLADTRRAFAELLADGWEARDVVEAYEAYFDAFHGSSGERGHRSERYAMWLVSWLTKASGARKWLARVGAKRRGDRASERRRAVTFGRATDGTWFADRGHGDIVPLSAALGRGATDDELMADYQASYPVTGVV